LGQLGVGNKTLEESSTPVTILLSAFKREHDKKPYKVKQVCAGKDHVLVLTENGKMFSWGSDGTVPSFDVIDDQKRDS
jgi:alpha-tubulin suppressor-like RCC1 family protein